MVFHVRGLGAWAKGSDGFRRLRALAPLAGVLLVGCATPSLVVDDAMELEDGRTRFVAFAEREVGLFFRGIRDVEVRFSVDGREVASARTDDRGVAMVVSKAEKGADRFEASATIGGHGFRSEGKVVQWRSDRTLIACDIDATISDTSLEALFFEEVDEKSQPIAGSVEELRAIAERFDLIYFTARPRFTLAKTREWLARHGYPEAPVLTSHSFGDMIAQTSYKQREIAKLREVFPNLLIGIGNSHIDSEGYGANGMLALIVNRTGETRYGRHTVEFHDWSQLREFFEANEEILESPERARAAAQGEELVLVPTLRWLGP